MCWLCCAAIPPAVPSRYCCCFNPCPAFSIVIRDTGQISQLDVMTVGAFWPRGQKACGNPLKKMPIYLIVSCLTCARATCAMNEKLGALCWPCSPSGLPPRRRLLQLLAMTISMPESIGMITVLQHQLIAPVSHQAVLSGRLLCRCCPGRKCLPECTGSAATKPQAPFWASAGVTMMCLRPVQGRCRLLRQDAGSGCCAWWVCQRLSCHASPDLLMRGRSMPASTLGCAVHAAWHPTAMQRSQGRCLIPEDVPWHKACGANPDEPAQTCCHQDVWMPQDLW